MKALKWSYAILVFAFLYCPIVVLVIFSFNESKYSGIWHGFTFNWYHQLFHDNLLLTVAAHSILLACIASSIANILGMIAAVALFRFRFMGKSYLQGLIFILLLIPDIVLGIALLILFTTLRIQPGFLTLLLAHITFCMPFTLVTIYSRLSDFDKSIFQAAKDLGASDLTVLRKILIPILTPALIAAWLLSFTLSIDDVMVSFFVSGPSYQILPLYIYSMIKTGVTPEMNALCSAMFMFTLPLLIIYGIVNRRRP
jgi:spermidine/putrescine transport system permease protein